jgi:hypothetical protein
MTPFAHFAGAPARAAERRRAEDADAREFRQIQEFVAACRRQWPSAVIVLRPDGASTSGAGAPTNTNLHPEDSL